MKYFIFLVMSLFLSVNVHSQESTDSNNIEGDLNTNTQNSTVDSYNTTNSNTTQNIGAGAGKATPPSTAISPALMSNGADTCLMSKGGAVQMDILGLSTGAYVQDEECNRRRDAKLFKDLGLSIVAVSRMCQNVDNWKSMFISGTPCPILVNGKMIFGKKALLVLKMSPEIYIPDYNEKDWLGKYKNKKFYDEILGIGEATNETNVTNDNDISISDRFRTSTRTATTD